MERIYSSIKKDVLLDVICRKEDIDKRREDFGSQEDALQVSFIEFKEGDSVPAHKHLKNIRETDRSFYLHRSREITIEDLLAKIKQERKRIIDLPFKPVYYTCDELEAIENLFIPPVYESPRPSDD